MDRRYTITGLIAILIVAGAGVWWYQGHTRYLPFTVPEVKIAGEYYEVQQFKGVASPDDPGALRACFRIERPIRAAPALEVHPPPAPDWFRCYDARFIAEALASGNATAYVAGRDEPPGYDRYIVELPGGRVYMWVEPARR